MRRRLLDQRGMPEPQKEYPEKGVPVSHSKEEYPKAKSKIFAP